MTPAQRTDAGLRLLHGATTLLGAAVVVAAFCRVVLVWSEQETPLLRILRDVAPWAHRGLGAGLALAAVGAAVTGAGEGGAAARALGFAGAIALGAAALLLRERVGVGALVGLQAEGAPALTVALALGLGWAFVARHAAALERARRRFEEAGSARRLAAHAAVAMAGFAGVLELARRLRAARAAGGDLDGPGTSLVVAGAGVAALLWTCTSWTLRVLARAREPQAALPAPEAAPLPGAAGVR